MLQFTNKLIMAKSSKLNIPASPVSPARVRTKDLWLVCVCCGIRTHNLCVSSWIVAGYKESKFLFFFYYDFRNRTGDSRIRMQKLYHVATVVRTECVRKRSYTKIVPISGSDQKKTIRRTSGLHCSGKMAGGDADEEGTGDRGGGGGFGGVSGRGGKRGVGRPPGAGAGAKKRKTISAKFAVFDRVLMGIYNADDVVQAYALATVSAIHITGEGCSYTLILDKGGEERDGVEEEWLFKSVEAV